MSFKKKKTKRKNKKKNTNKCYQEFNSLFKDYNILDPDRDLNGLIKRITKRFGVSKNILNIQYNTSNKELFKICKPPKTKLKIAKEFISKMKNIEFKLNNNNKGKYRVLWTGWEQLSQLVACYIANYISINYNESRAIEQTNFTKNWVKICGTWDTEYKMIKKILETNNPNIKDLDNDVINKNMLDIFDRDNDKMISKEEIRHYFYSKNKRLSEKKLKNIINENKNIGEYLLDSETMEILKKIWDKYSIMFSKYKGLDNTIIILPDFIDKDILDKTLAKIELLNLNTSKICVLMFQISCNFIINPHLKSSKKYNSKDKQIILDFIPWNKKEKKSIINFLRKNRNQKLRIL